MVDGDLKAHTATVNDSRRKLIALLQLAYSDERAAAHAYRGHWNSVRDRNERASIRSIEEDEWRHRKLVGEMLASLAAAPNKWRELRAMIIGRVLGLLCHVTGWLAPMYGAGKLESRNIREYETAARHARDCDRGDLIDCLLEMAEVEWEHELYFRSRVKEHFLGRRLPLWPQPPPKETIRLSLERGPVAHSLQMNSMNIKRKVFAGALLLCTAAVTPGLFGQQQPQRLSKDTLIVTAREIIATARYCALITLDSKGRAHVRTMDPFPPDENLVIWFGTNPKSRKVAEIRRNHRVLLYYFDRESPAYVTISGIARLVNDAREKAKHWKDEWKAFYPDREKGYLLIAVTPRELEIVNEKKGIVGDADLWTPPTIRFGSGRPRGTPKALPKR